MLYSFLADIVGLVHFAYVGFVVVGQLLILLGLGFGWRWIRDMRFRLLHLTMILIVALESLGHLMCPLTTWENNLRELAGQPVAGDSFVANLLNHVMFFNAIPYDHWIFKAGYVSFAAIVVMTFIIAPPCRRWRDATITRPTRGVLVPAILATLGGIFVYTALCMQNYKDSVDEKNEQAYQEALAEHAAEARPPVKEDRLPVYFLAFSGMNFLGMAMVCWALAPTKAASKKSD
jgi:hypothetical protein